MSGHTPPWWRFVNDASWFDEILREHWGTIVRFANLQVDGSEVDDVISATLQTAWEKIADVPVEQRPAWLLAVTRNHARNVRRARRRRSTLSAVIAAHAIEFDGDPQDDPSVDPADLALLAAAERRLSHHDRELLALWVWENLSPAEIAAVLRLRDNTVRVRLHRARRRLAEAYRAIQSEQAAEAEGTDS